ncbi:MAG: hypothetical protein ACRDYX_02635, partial [Egibacteraceae bacterium]
MVDVTWAYCRFAEREGPEEQVWNQYRNLLNGLLVLHEDDPGSPGAWILHDPQQEGEVPEWRSGVDAQRTVGLIAQGLRQCELASTRAWMEHEQKLLATQMNLSGCRIYLAPERAMALATKLITQPDPSTCPIPDHIHVCIDFRFQEHLGRYWLYATLSVWTYKPSSDEHAPPSTPATRTALRLSPSDVADLHNWHQALRVGFKERVREHFRLAEMTILDREHRPPRFWYTRNTKPLATPRTIDDLTVDRLNTLVNALPCAPDVRSAGVAAGVIDEGILVLRRFVPDDEGELPCYLIYPYRGERAERENEARLVAWELTDLEASAAAQLFEVVTSLDIYASHLRVYEAVVHEAEELWDQLALYLPMKKGRHVHPLIELVHQTLLQGIADLDQVAIQTKEREWRVERSASDLKDRFGRTFTERPLTCLPGADPISVSLIKTGYFEKAALLAKRVLSHAAQVQSSYRTLLNGITRAFDEQRVRGIDVLQHVGLVLAVLVVVFGFVPEALNVIFDWWDPTLLALLTTVGIVGFGILGSMVLWRMRRLRTLGSARFRPHHKQLQEFLASCATDRLTRFREDGWKRVRATLDEPSKNEGSAWNEFFAEWDKRDYELAHQCAELLDELVRFEVSESAWSDRTPRLGDLARQVERWA